MKKGGGSAGGGFTARGTIGVFFFPFLWYLRGQLTHSAFHINTRM